MKTPRRIPEELEGFFWDVNVKKLDPSKKPYFVIQRLLDKGNVQAVRWVRQNYTPQDIAETFYHMRDFRTKVGRFWEAFLDLSPSKVLCLQKPYLATRRMHWPY